MFPEPAKLFRCVASHGRAGFSGLRNPLRHTDCLGHRLFIRICDGRRRTDRNRLVQSDDLIGKEHIYKVPSWLFGCHPYHNYSWVAAVGAARPKQVFYGNNRADFSFIPGNMAPGLLFRQPDHFENYDDWPFLWGQNEGTIAGNTGYLIWGETFRNAL